MATASLQQLEGKYEILEQLQVGGMGAIYKVRHRLLGDLRVVKVMRPQLMSDESLRKRFHREAKAAIQLSHPNIAQLYDFTLDEEGRAYMVMEYIEGWTLAELVDRGELPPVGCVLEIARQGLEAIGHLHKKGLVHRDISPDNLMLTRDVDGAAAVKLIDLGLIKAAEGTGTLTASGMFLGKFQYASPEHFGQGATPVGPWSDLYSFGLVLYEVLTGRYPIVGRGPSSLIAGHLFRSPLSFDDTDPTGRIPAELRQVVERSLAKSKDERYPSAEIFAEALVPLAERYPATAAETERLLDLVSQPRERPQLDDETHDTTQSRFDHQFAAQETRAAIPSVAPREVPTTLVVDRQDGELGELLSRIEGHLVEGRLRAARAELDAARAERGDTPQLMELAGRLQETEEISRRSQVGELLSIAQEATSRQDYASALEALEQAIRLAGDDHQVRRLLAETRRAARRHSAEEQQRAQIEERAHEIEEHLASGRLEEAARALYQAPRSYGHDERWESLDKRLDTLERERDLTATAAEIEAQLEAHERLEAKLLLLDAERRFGAEAPFQALRKRLDKLEEEEHRRRLDAVLAEIDGLLAEGLLEEAGEAIGRARESGDADERELDERQRRLDAEVEQAVGSRHGNEVARRSESIEGLLASGELETAQVALAEARRELGEEAAWERLATRLDEARRRRDAAEVRRLVREADELARESQNERAYELLERAEQIDPTNPVVQEEKQRVAHLLRHGQRRRERQVEIAETCSRIDGLLVQESLAEAAAALDEAERTWGSIERLQALRARLDGQRRRRDRQRRLEEALEHVESLRGDGRLEEALEETLLLREEAPLNKLVELQVFELEQELAERRDKVRREAAKRAAEAEIRGLVERGDLEAASRRLPGALDAAGPTIVLQNLKAQVEKHLGEPRAGGGRRRRADELVAKARGLAQSEDFEPAAELLREALGLVADHPEGLALRASVETCLEIRHEETRSEAEVTSSVAGIRDLIHGGRSVEALQELEEATQRFGERPDLADLRYEAVRGRIARDLDERTVALAAAAEEPTFQEGTAQEPSPELQASEAVTDVRSALATVAIKAVGTAVEPTPLLPTEPPGEPAPGPGVTDSQATQQASAAKTEILPAVTEAVPAVRVPATEAPTPSLDKETTATSVLDPVAAADQAEAPGRTLVEPQRNFDEKTLRGIPQLRDPQVGTLDGLTLGPDDDEESFKGWEEPLPAKRSSTSVVFLAAVVVIIPLSLGAGFWLSREGVLKPPAGEGGIAVEEVAPAEMAPGYLALDALPWGELERVVDGEGVEQPLPTARTTPLVLALQPGTYRLSLRYPPRKKSAEVEVTIVAGQRLSERTRLSQVSARSLLRAAGSNPSSALRQVAEAYVAGDYELVLQRAGDDLGFPNARERTFALLLRAAARWSLYVLGGKQERWMLEGVAEEIRIGRGLKTDLRIDETLFPPRFHDLYTAGQ